MPVETSDGPLAPNEVAGSTIVTLISAGTEVAQYRIGPFPLRPGYAAVFRIEAVGSAVTQLAVGDRVLCMGPHASFQRQAAREVVRLPNSLAPEVAVFARMMAVTMSTLATTAARPPAKVLVTGLGLVGNLAAQVFDHCGYDVIACDGDTKRRSLLRSDRITTVSAVPLDDPHVAQQVALVVECSGSEQTVLDGCRVVRKRGEVVLVGVPWRAKTEVSAHTLLHTVFHRYVVLRSGWEWELPLHAAEQHTNNIFDNLAAAMHWLARGQIEVTALANTARPAQAQAVYQRLLLRHNPMLATMFDWQAAS